MEVEEFETFQQQALEVTPPDENFDPTKRPQSGEEYLMHMLYERKRCPTVVVKRPKNLEQQNSKTTFANMEDIEQFSPYEKNDTSLLPTIEWKNAQSCNFLRTRSKIMILRQQLSMHNYNNSLEPPLVTDELAWLKFCQENQPLLSTILRLNQRTLEQLLAMLSNWLRGETNGDSTDECLPLAASSSTSAAASSVDILDLACSDQWLGDWLYGVLACLHLPLEPTVHSTLRDIARSCMRLRSRLKSHEFEKAIPYNLFIYLIGKSFDQLDLLQYV